jgi:hypothetical protein
MGGVKVIAQQIVPAIEKISRIDSSVLLHELKVRLAMLKSERDIIDVKLDESEMVQLTEVLRKVLSIGNKKVSNSSTIDAIANIDVTKAEPTAVRRYFENKFGAQDNFFKVINSANNHYIKNTKVEAGNYFAAENSQSRILAFPVVNTNAIKIVDLMS